MSTLIDTRKRLSYGFFICKYHIKLALKPRLPSSFPRNLDREEEDDQ